MNKLKLQKSDYFLVLIACWSHKQKKKVLALPSRWASIVRLNLFNKTLDSVSSNKKKALSEDLIDSDNRIMINFLNHHKQSAVIKIHGIHTVNTDNDMIDPMSESYTGQRETLNIH